MLALTLLAGGGLTISRMICESSGTTTYKLGQMKSCSGTGEHNECVNGLCCKMSSAQLEQDSRTVTSKPEQPQQDLQVVAIPFLSPIASTPEVSAENEPYGFDPPNLGLTILRLITVLLI